jgi:hypothetical protein
MPRAHNEVMSMLIQALGYGLSIWRTHSGGHAVALAWLISVVAVIGLVNRQVFWERSLPTFLGGLGRRPVEGGPNTLGGRGGSSVGQSSGLIIRRSQVQVLPAPPIETAGQRHHPVAVDRS